MREHRLLARIEASGRRQRGMQCEQAVEPGARRDVGGEIAADAREGRVADRTDRPQPVGRATLDDEDEPPGGGGAGKGHARCKGAGEAAEHGGSDDVATIEHGLSPHRFGCDEQQRERLPGAFGARQRLGRGGAHRSGEQRRRQSAGIDRPARARREPLRRLDPAHHRIRPRPTRGDIIIAGRLSGLPHRLAELSQQAGDRAG